MILLTPPFVLRPPRLHPGRWSCKVRAHVSKHLCFPIAVVLLPRSSRLQSLDKVSEVGYIGRLDFDLLSPKKTWENTSQANSRNSSSRMMPNLKRPELKLSGSVSENFKNFELRFHDYCIQADYWDLEKNPDQERRLLQETSLRGLGSPIRLARRSFTGDTLHHRTPDTGWRSKETMDLDE